MWPFAILLQTIGLLSSERLALPNEGRASAELTEAANPMRDRAFSPANQLRGSLLIELRELRRSHGSILVYCLESSPSGVTGVAHCSRLFGKVRRTTTSGDRHLRENL